MKTGRPPKPTALHKLHGTDRPYVRRRAQTEPQPVGDLHSPPNWFNASQRAGWWYVIHNAPLHLLKKLDRGMLAMWVVAEDQHRLATITQNRLNEKRPDLPFLIKSPLGMVTSPYIDVISQATKTMFKAGEHLGFSPMARPRIKIEPPASEEQDPATNPWSILKLVPGGKTD